MHDLYYVSKQMCQFNYGILTRLTSGTLSCLVVYIRVDINCMLVFAICNYSLSTQAGIVNNHIYIPYIYIYQIQQNDFVLVFNNNITLFFDTKMTLFQIKYKLCLYCFKKKNSQFTHLLHQFTMMPPEPKAIILYLEKVSYWHFLTKKKT